ncbi:MAG: bifunctional UDP-3-O-[3-hydroxymyristoyl] N-acetylglucosamine deacetylase/3-hydroxyacyl-ACP dehydratase [Limisphaera sp.]|nr:bifunctional UDP-3-O-[3-hydroxymyristoyl] N-acetylglucosamine deacetylase/3-hydroxyacyl-ACP dehydratase [Limisphaera sp.]
MLSQQTIKRSVNYSGVGLHSGNRVTLTLLPAPPGHGIRFRRVDLEARPEIEARIENVVDTQRSTTLGKGSVRIHTVEHVLAALSGCGVDNVIVELDANEPPIGDGSAREYCKLIHAAGLQPQEAPRQVYAVTEPLAIQLGDSFMHLVPAPEFRISCTSADRSGHHTQFFSLVVTPESWERELAHARTFCFFEEIEYLIKNGLIKGGSLENAIVIRDDAVLTTEPLRYPEEFVRHKMLDIVGDLALLGRPILGHLLAVRPSHTANCELVRQLDARYRRATPLGFGPPAAEIPCSETVSSNSSHDVVLDACALDIQEIMKLIPHRYPFLLVDRIAVLEENRIVGVKNVTINEPFFQGHFPGHPVFPGVLQLEAIAQVAGVLMRRKFADKPQIAYFMSAEEVKWRKPVWPGDTLVVEVDLLKARGKVGKARGQCKVRGEVVSEAVVTFMLMDA